MLKIRNFNEKNYSKSSNIAKFDYLTLKPSILVKELKISSKNSSNLSQQAKNRSKKRKPDTATYREISNGVFLVQNHLFVSFLLFFFARA